MLKNEKILNSDLWKHYIEPLLPIMESFDWSVEIYTPNIEVMADNVRISYLNDGVFTAWVVNSDTNRDQLQRMSVKFDITQADIDYKNKFIIIHIKESHNETTTE